MTNSKPITKPSEPIGNIPRSVDLLESVVKGESEDPWLVTLVLGGGTFGNRGL